MSSKAVFIFRHGETDWNRERRMQGQTDRPLNSTGLEQAQSLIPFLREQKIEAIFSSDLLRAQATAKVVAESLQIPIFLSPALRETNLGEAEGLTTDEITAKWGEEIWSRWASIKESDWTFAFPGGENKTQHRIRVQAAIEKFLAENHYTRIAVSTHGGAMRRLLHHWQPDLSEPVMVGNCAIYAAEVQLPDFQWKVLGHLNPKT
jgi:probable phosphoglycerate mutase